VGGKRMKVAIAGYKEFAPGVFDVWGYVTSESKEGVVYHVRVTVKWPRMVRWACECEDHVFRGLYGPCKHSKLLAVAFANAYKRGKLDEVIQRGAKWVERRLGIPAHPRPLGSKAPAGGPSSRAEPGRDQGRRASEPAYA